MEVVIAAGGLSFGPTTLQHRSLGGSETAAMQLALEIRRLGHIVTVFCNLPPQGHPDFFESGHSCSDGVRWVSIEQYVNFISHSEVDLLIVSRDPAMFAVPHQAKKAIFWMHDLATIKTFKPRLMDTAWNFDEIWTVSEWHRQQVHKVTGYPLTHIVATRNGIVKYDVMDIPREEKSLLYSARPERGLENLVKVGGIMEQLPDFNLKVTMYENYPDHMMEYYHGLWQRCQDLPNVELLGPKTQLELRQIMKASWAYIYPTSFEEVSCIIARECIEQELPIFTTPVGALVETLDDGCAVFYESKEDHIGDEAFCKGFADLVRQSAEQGPTGRWANVQSAMRCRKDLYWDEVATHFLEGGYQIAPSDYSLALSLIKDADIICAMEVLKDAESTSGVQWLMREIHNKYPFLTRDISFADHYEKIYKHEDKKGVKERNQLIVLTGNPRYEVIKEMIPKGAERVVEFGCAEGPIILGLAQELPDIQFVGIDIVEDNVALCRKYAEEHNITNVEFHIGDISKDVWGGEFDAGIISEVLEHVEKPWECLNNVEASVKIGGRIIGTTPNGPWEWSGLRNVDDWNWRAHIWHLDKKSMRSMLDGKKEVILSTITHSHFGTRALGHVGFSYECDRELIDPIDIGAKIKAHRPRQSIGACMIAMNDEADILKCLDSIANQIDVLQIAIGPSTDHTVEYVGRWAEEHPWIDFRWVMVPKICAPGEGDKGEAFGFDDARNASLKGVDTDWILWIDSDEYLSGVTMGGYCRNNAFDSYALFQHHFTCEPRGNPAQLDKPARLIRNNHGFEFYGKVHEHAEIGYNGGPGFVMVLSDMDIGHTGYVNEQVRMSRFSRNYPLLEWDRELFPERKIGGYLWLRDMMHRVHILDQMGDKKQAIQLAEEAIQFYRSNIEDWGGVGGGMNQNSALAYYSSALEYLQLGAVVSITMAFEGQEANYVGRFLDTEEALNLATKGLKEQFELVNNRYNQ